MSVFDYRSATVDFSKRLSEHSQGLGPILRPHAQQEAPYPFEAVAEWNRQMVALHAEGCALLPKIRDRTLRQTVQDLILLAEDAIAYLRQKNH